jgi:hypothetical protein
VKGRLPYRKGTGEGKKGKQQCLDKGPSKEGIGRRWRSQLGSIVPNLEVSEVDLKDECILIDVHPDEIMFAQELVDGLMYFHQCGVFRRSCTPAAF